jgi:hypothetical protein
MKDTNLISEHTLRCFASYSHFDARIVKPAVALLGAVRARTFLDSISLQPGDDWAAEISKSIGESEIVFVFWSTHASRSKYVEMEFSEALSCGKKVIPVLLDDSPLPQSLRSKHCVDFRSAMPVYPGRPWWPSDLPRWKAYLSTAIFAILGLLIYRTLRSEGLSVLVSALLAVGASVLLRWSPRYFDVSPSQEKGITAEMNPAARLASELFAAAKAATTTGAAS